MASDAVENSDLAQATSDKRHNIRRSAGRWALAGGGCLIVGLIGVSFGIAVPTIALATTWLIFAAVLGLLSCLLMAIIQLARSASAHAHPDELRRQARPKVPVERREVLQLEAPLVIRPSAAGYTNKWVRNLSLPAVGFFVVVFIYRLNTLSTGGRVVLVALSGLAVVAILFFFHAKIVLYSSALFYRRLIVGRRFPLSRVGGMAIRSLDLTFNYYARRPPPYAIVYDTDGKSLFALSAALWPSADLGRLQEALGGDTSDRSMKAQELQDEFRGALPWWAVFMDSHPIWTVVIGAPLMLVMISFGIFLWDILTTGNP